MRSKSGTARPKVGRGSKIWDQANGPPQDQSWIWISREMLESPAFQALSLHARRTLDRIYLEHLAHAGQENGNLVVTWANLRQWGISGKHVGAALRELQEFGFIRIERGRGGNAEFRRPSLYTLTTRPAYDGSLPRNDWRAITTDQAKLIKAKLKAAYAKRVKPPTISASLPAEITRALHGSSFQTANLEDLISDSVVADPAKRN